MAYGFQHCQLIQRFVGGNIVCQWRVTQMPDGYPGIIRSVRVSTIHAVAS